MEEKSQKFAGLLELILVIFLGITSVAGAFAAFQSALNSSAMSKEYNEGISEITDANSEYVTAGQVISNDMTLYQQLIKLSFDMDYAATPEEKEKATEQFNQFSSKFLSQNLLDAISWAEDQETQTGNYISPFDYEPYLEEVYRVANEQYQSGRMRLETGHVYNTSGDKMGLIVIYYATVLFLLGVAMTMKRTSLKIGLAAFSFAIFVFASVQMFGIPFLAP